MVTKKDLIIAILGTFCLTSTLFMIMPSRSPSSNGAYDPWMDLNDDGVIDSTDLGLLGANWGTLGTPINKTALLLELQSKVDDLNAIVNSLMERVDALEANYSVTNLKLAPNAIPFNSTNGNSTIYASNTITYKDMADMIVDLTLDRPSQVLIMFSANALQDSDAVQQIEIMALVNESYLASPGPVYLNPGVSVDIFYHSHYLSAGSFTYVFYALINEAGTYTIKIKWRVTGGTGQIGYRSLTVIGLPA